MNGVLLIITQEIIIKKLHNQHFLNNTHLRRVLSFIPTCTNTMNSYHIRDIYIFCDSIVIGTKLFRFVKYNTYMPTRQNIQNQISKRRRRVTYWHRLNSCFGAQ